MNIDVDHLVICVQDLGPAASHYTETLGIEIFQGGRHPGHGTENLIAPLGGAYIELVAVVDPEEATNSLFGSWVMSRADSGGIHALCLRTDDIDDAASVSGAAPVSMSRSRPDGVELRWRIAGLENALATGTPFFIEWEAPGDAHPGFREDGRALLERVELSVGGRHQEVSLSSVPGLVVVEGHPRVRAWVSTARGAVQI